MARSTLSWCTTGPVTWWRLQAGGERCCGNAAARDTFWRALTVKADHGECDTQREDEFEQCAHPFPPLQELHASKGERSWKHACRPPERARRAPSNANKGTHTAFFHIRAPNWRKHCAIVDSRIIRFPEIDCGWDLSRFQQSTHVSLDVGVPAQRGGKMTRPPGSPGRRGVRALAAD